MKKENKSDVIMGKIILGAGLSGLSAAHYLLKKFPEEAITILESGNRSGGWIKSTLLQNNLIFEQGPRTIRPRGEAGANTLGLIGELGLADEIVPISQNHPAATTRMVYAKGKLNILPSNIFHLFIKQSPFSKPLIMHLSKDITTPKKYIPEGDEALYNFIERRFGSEIADYLISPLICGICAGNAKEISVHFLIKSLFEMEQNYGSISRGLVANMFRQKETQEYALPPLARKARIEKWNVYSFKNGIETLPKLLEQTLLKNGVKIEYNTKINAIQTRNDKISITLNNNKQIETDYLISAIPAVNLANLLKNQHPELAAPLQHIESVTVAVVNLCFEKQLISKDAFGFLVAPKENLPILGVIYDSCCFPKDNHTLLTVMMGGYWFKQQFGLNPADEDLFNVALSQVQKILGFSDSPKHFKVNILRDCIPQYTVGHTKRVADIESYLHKNQLKISVCGSSYYGVGVNDVILSAKNAVEALT